MTDKLTALHDILFPIILESTARARVTDVLLQDDLDHDGDPILRITVIVAGDRFRLDPAHTLETTRLVRDVLLAADDPRFPVVTYISEADHQRLVDEAA